MAQSKKMDIATLWKAYTRTWDQIIGFSAMRRRAVKGAGSSATTAVSITTNIGEGGVMNNNINDHAIGTHENNESSDEDGDEEVDDDDDRNNINNEAGTADGNTATATAVAEAIFFQP